MKQYLDLIKDVLENGEQRQDRTGVGTISVFGRQIRFNLQEGFPAVTTKKLAWKAVVSELLWFLEGSTDERRLCEILHGTRDSSKTTIWTANANADYWKDKAEFEGDLKNVYGRQWRDWSGVDQIKNLIEGLKNDPYGRRHIVSAWNVKDINDGNMALPPCHVMAQFYVSNDGRLSCHMYQRSNDVFLGEPFNVASYALLTHMIAQARGLDVGELVVSTGDTHLYLNSVEAAKEQLTREPFPLPKIWLNPEINDINKFTMDDIKLVDYKSHEQLKVPMAV